MSKNLIAKPQMRGLLVSQIKRNLIILGCVVTTYVFAFNHFVCNDRKKRYAEFNRTYDPEAAFERLKKRGVFNSVQ